MCYKIQVKIEIEIENGFCVHFRVLHQFFFHLLAHAFHFLLHLFRGMKRMRIFISWCCNLFNAFDTQWCCMLKWTQALKVKLLLCYVQMKVYVILIFISHTNFIISSSVEDHVCTQYQIHAKNNNNNTAA